jgi:hypothetical protein
LLANRVPAVPPESMAEVAPLAGAVDVERRGRSEANSPCQSRFSRGGAGA